MQFKPRRFIFPLVLLFAVNLFAQEIFPRKRTQTEEQQQATFQNQQAKNKYWRTTPQETKEQTTFLPTYEEQALEKIIDPETYIVGPGDLFFINITGDKTYTFPSKVTPEGKLVIETLGSYFVAGKKLSKVQDLVFNEGKKKYKLKKVFANLVELRKLRVHVLGEVEFPGIYIVNSVDRVSFLLETAGIGTWADEHHIQIRHVNAEVDTFDFVRYKKDGFLEDNIYVQNGDVIFVPSLKSGNPSVIVEGFIEEPGIYPIKKGEKLSDFVTRLKGFDRTIDPSKITITRSANPGGTEVFHVNLFSNNNDDDLSDIALQNGDRIYLPTVINRVYVQGAVNVPGGYYYMVGLKAKDYVGLAGGIKEMGNLKKVRVLHFDDNTEDRGPEAEVRPGDTIIVPQTSRRIFLDYLQIITSISSIILAYLATQR